MKTLLDKLKQAVWWNLIVRNQRRGKLINHEEEENHKWAIYSFIFFKKIFFKKKKDSRVHQIEKK